MKNLNVTLLLLIGMLFGFNTQVIAGGPITVTKEITIDASIDKAWMILGTEFDDAYKWASSITHSEAKNNESLNGSTCSVRGCDVTGMGSIKEKLTAFSDTDHMLAYEVLEGMPKMMRSAKNTWSLIDLGNGKSKLIMNMEAQTGGFMGWMMKPMMKMKLNKMGDNLMEEFKFYVENGQAHPRVAKAS